MTFDEIAAELGVKRYHVTDALQYWYESRGLEYFDGRTRRKNRKIPDRRSA